MPRQDPKGKGSEWEREVGRLFSLWFTSGERDDLVTRTVLSGGQFSSTNRGCPGDLTSPHPIGYAFFQKVVLECKHWKFLDFWPQFLNQRGELYWEVQKVKKTAASCLRSWMMVSKQNYQPALLIYPTALLPLTTTAFPWHSLFCGEMIATNLDSFLKHVSVKDWEESQSRPPSLERVILKKLDEILNAPTLPS